MKLRLIALFTCIGLSAVHSFAQNTVGTVLNTMDANNEYRLFTPSTTALPNFTYLIDNCGQVVQSWESDFQGFGAEFLAEDGSLYRASIDNDSDLSYNGLSGRIERFDWDGNLIWSFQYAGTDFSFHHDFTVLPNGNVLMMIAERRTRQEAEDLGRDPSSLLQEELYDERIIEVAPVGANDGTIVWEWSFFDHLIQDFDSTKENFGVIADHPERLDINFIDYSNFGETNNADWIHFNSIDYNEALDQIVLSARGPSEFYVIDHSTTTAEAATSVGGNSGMGGDILYRFGNPQAYDRGAEGERQTFTQHSVHWIDTGSEDDGKFMLFNNGSGRGFSSVEIIDQPVPDDNGVYPISASAPFEGEVNVAYQANTPTDFFSPIVSSAYKSDNEHLTIVSGTQGRIFETDADGNIVWEYINPVSISNEIVSQGEAPPVNNDTRIFRATRYGTDFPGFVGRDLTPGSEIEQNPIPENCELFLNLNDFNESAKITLYPNPASDVLNIQHDLDSFQITLYDMHGRIVKEVKDDTVIDVSNLRSGMYLARLTTGVTQKTIPFVKI